MPRRWLASLAALSIAFSLASFSQAKPPDLPKYERIIVVTPPGAVPADPDLPVPTGYPLPPLITPPTEPDLASPPLLTGLTMMGLQPIQLLGSTVEAIQALAGSSEEASEETTPATEEEKPGKKPEPIRPMPEEEPDEQASACPYLRNQLAEQPVRVFLGPIATRTVMENLQQLEKVAQGMAEARRLAQEGRLEEAAKCLQELRRCCAGTPCEKRIDALLEEVGAEEQEKSESAAAQEAEGCCCCPLGGMCQFGMCWMSQVLGWLGQQGACCREAKVCQAALYLPMSAHFDNVPLRALLQNLQACIGMELVIDEPGLREAGIDLDTPVSLHAQNLPLGQLLGLVLKPLHLNVAVRAGKHTIVADVGCHQDAHNASPPEQPEQPKMCGGSACPKCEELHARHNGKAEMVRGLLKACYLAIELGRHEKAIDLARQAHAIDPARVEADPLVYKLHLLAEHGKVLPGSGAEEPAESSAGDVPLKPHLPETRADVVEALDAILTGADGLKTKPARK